MDRPEKRNLGDQAAKARAAAMIGAVVSGRYRIVELIAMGGVGAVYLAEHVHMHKHVAVKILHPDPGGGPDLVARFEREAVAGAHIQHPNVAAATDFGRLDDGSSFLVLEYVRGTTLREVIRRGPMSPARAIRIARQICSALGAAHTMGIIHRDVKPRNVMLIEGERDVVKLIDFGLAKLELRQVSAVAASRASFDEERITTSGAVFGTIAYLAPEAAMGMDLVDARADLYALGLVLYEMLAGRHPFDTADPVELFRQHHKVPPPPIAERSPGAVVPARLEAIVRRLLEKTPEARYQDVDEVIAALDEAHLVESVSVAPLALEGLPVTFPGPSLAPPSYGFARGGLSASDLESDSRLRTPSGLPPAMPVDITPPAPSAGTPSAAVVPALLPPTVAAPAHAPKSRVPLVFAGLTVVAILAVAGGFAARGGGDRSPGSSADPASSAPITTVGAGPSAVGSSPPSPVAKETPVASTAAAASSTASSTASAPPVDLGAARGLFRRLAASHDVGRATDAFFALVDQGSEALHDPTLLAPARDLAASLALVGGEPADRMFAALANRSGSDGPDVLYELVRTRGGSKAAARALELLDKPDVIARATPALRVTVALRSAPCPEKAALLDRATKEGDQRTVVVMETVVAACLGRNQALEDAEKELKRRVR